MIAADVGIEAAQEVGELAAQEEIEWALAGGLAMHLYGSQRLTKDVDIIASQELSLTASIGSALVAAATGCKLAKPHPQWRQQAWLIYQT